MTKLLSQAWTVVMVTVITLLVWLYAEDANVKTYNNERVLVRFVAPGDGEMIIEPGGATVLASLSGSNGQFQQFRKRVENNTVIEIPVLISPGMTSATINVDLRKQLEEGVLANLGLNLTELDQETVDVSIQKVERVPLDVNVIRGPLRLVRDEATTSVEQVFVYLPATLAADARRGPPARIDLTAADLDDIPQGEDTQLTLPIILPDLGDLPEGFDPRPSATEATVSFRLVIDRELYSIERLHVKLTGPASVGDRYVVSIPAEHQFLNNLEVQGPPAQIALLRENAGSPNVLATIELTNAEADEAAAGDGVITKPVLVFINLPGVRLVAEPSPIPVEVRLREAPAGE